MGDGINSRYLIIKGYLMKYRRLTFIKGPWRERVQSCLVVEKGNVSLMNNPLPLPTGVRRHPLCERQDTNGPKTSGV